MSRVIGHTHRDAGHRDHVPYQPDLYPEHEGMDQVLIAEGVEVPDGLGIGSPRVIVRTSDVSEVEAHLDCGHTAVVDAPAEDPSAALAALEVVRTYLTSEIYAEAKAELETVGEIDCPVCTA